MQGIKENQLIGLAEQYKLKPGLQRVELFLACRKLADKDFFSKSDPQIKLYIPKPGGGEQLIAETEIINNNLNPDFTQTFTLEYFFEKKQPLHFQIIDIDSRDGKKFDLLGDVNTTLAAIMGAKGQVSLFEIILNKQPSGHLIIRAEFLEGIFSLVSMQIRGSDLKKPPGLNSMNAFFEFTRLVDGQQVKIFQSEPIKSPDPYWKKITIPMQHLCHNDVNLSIVLNVYTQRQTNEKAMIGQTTFTVSSLQQMASNSNKVFQLMLKGEKAGTIKIDSFSIEYKPGFLEYLRGGVQLNVLVAIDFTTSNGEPDDPNSLHALKPKNGDLNAYQSAITGVCDILLNYDYDKKVPMYGFGGKPIKAKGGVNHCFALTFNEKNPFCDGLQGMNACYLDALSQIQLMAPTNFCPVIRKAMDFGQKSKQTGSANYYILLILTDGAIHDMDATIDAIVASVNLPLSIIIVGVGNEDFSKMKFLDGDKSTLYSSKGIPSGRDLVQFVPFNEFKGDKLKLAEHLLEEVPEQFIKYMTSQNILPKPKQLVSIEDLLNSYNLVKGLRDRLIHQEENVQDVGDDEASVAAKMEKINAPRLRYFFFVEGNKYREYKITHNLQQISS